MPSIDYLTHIKSLEDAGKTDAEIAAILSALTASPIKIADAENFFDWEGLAKRSARTAAWEGSLPDVIDLDPQGLPAPLQGLPAGVDKLFTHINKPRSEIIDTTAAEWALMAADLLAGLQALGTITAQQASGFLALGGGLRHGAVAEQDVADARTAYQAQVAADAQAAADAAARAAVIDRYWQGHNSSVAPVLDGETLPTKAAVIAAMRAAADAWEAEV